MNTIPLVVGVCSLLGLIPCSTSAEGGAAPPHGDYHVSTHGDDADDGSEARPLRTISAAAQRALPGDVITVHEGVYRERVDPPRGGTSDSERITYQAAPGERVVIKGSEPITGWQEVRNDTWKVTLPNAFFGDFNPYREEIRGDWFAPHGRPHHSGAVYLEDHWLIEAATLEDVLRPVGQTASSYLPDGDPYLLNVAWLRPPGENAERLPATGFAAQHGVRSAVCSEGGECLGWIEAGDWVRYEGVDLGEDGGEIELRVASAGRGGLIEIRRDAPDGELLGTGAVPPTGGWQSWTSVRAKLEAGRGVQTICLLFREDPGERRSDVRLWFARVDSTNTTLWGQFAAVDPNEARVEINVRRAVFYPERPGIDYLTVRGFTMMHAATPWAPPTAEQIGLLGTHWSKGWIIENNDIRYSVCTGITLGKHGDEFDNTSQNSAEGYVKTIERAHEHGWSKENIGHHLVRNNRISHCEQAGIVGSMGSAFCTVTGNVIHDIHVRRLFGGAEMAAIKFHGAIDTLISHNHIYRTTRGIWLDWMTQGTRVTRNLLHDTGPGEDLFMEVNHGPFLVDNNLFLSERSLLVNSQGGAYVHNLIAGGVRVIHGEGRQTPYHAAHSTEVVGLHGNPSGDDRYYNNLFVKLFAGLSADLFAEGGLAAYDPAELPVFLNGNVFLGGARPSKHDSHPRVLPEADPGLELIERTDGLYLRIALDESWVRGPPRPVVTTALLGTARIPGLPYVRPDGSPYVIDTDYFGHPRTSAHPFPGPIEPLEDGGREWRVWTANRSD
jgi:alpha-L-arabinofuranosidase